MSQCGKEDLMNKGIATGRDRDSCPFNVSVGMEGKDINGHGQRSRWTDLPPDE